MKELHKKTFRNLESHLKVFEVNSKNTDIFFKHGKSQ